MNTHPETFVSYFILFVNVNFCECIMLISLICVYTYIIVKGMLVPFFLPVWGLLRLAPVNMLLRCEFFEYMPSINRYLLMNYTDSYEVGFSLARCVKLF